MQEQVLNVVKYLCQKWMVWMFRIIRKFHGVLIISLISRKTSRKYIVNVDKNGKGLLQFSTGRLKGRKLFSWGSNAASDHWQEFLTKDAGRYVEIQAGLGKTQYGCIPMAPHTAWEWMECYGPAYSEELTAEIY